MENEVSLCEACYISAFLVVLVVSSVNALHQVYVARVEKVIAVDTIREF